MDPTLSEFESERSRAALADKLAREAAAILEVSDVDRISKLTKAIGESLDEYLTELLARSLRKSAKDQKQQLRKLRDHLIRAHASIGDLSPEYLVAVGDLADRAVDDSALDIVKFTTDLLAVAAGVSAFLERFEPSRAPPANHALELAVRHLVPVVESVSGQTAEIRWNKPEDKPPEPRSKSAISVVHVLRRFPSAPSQIAILNMVGKVQRQPEQKPDELDAVIRTHFDEMDAALLGRKS